MLKIDWEADELLVDLRCLKVSLEDRTVGSAALQERQGRLGVHRPRADRSMAPFPPGISSASQIPGPVKAFPGHLPLLDWA